MTDKEYSKIVSQNLRRIAYESGKVQSEIAKELGMSKATLSAWMNGTRTPKMPKIDMLCAYFGVKRSDIMEPHDEPLPRPATRIPVLGYVAAGIPIDAIEDVLDWEEITPAMSVTGEFFGLRIKGDSMQPHFVVEAIRKKGYVTKLTPHQISNYFQKKQMSLGVEPPYCFHSLRHYNASFLHSQGIPDAYIMARGGWASPHVMQRVYRHALQDKVAGMEQKAVGALQFSLQF